MKFITAIILSAGILATSACASAKKPKANKGENEIEQLCNYVTDETAYYGNGIGESTDMQMAKDKATAAARAEIAEAVKISLERFTKRFRSDRDNTAEQKFEDSMQTITVQTMAGTSIICSRVVRAENGRYRAYVSVKLPKETVVNAVKDAVVKNEPGKSLDERQQDFDNSIREEIINSGK